MTVTGQRKPCVYCDPANFKSLGKEWSEGPMFGEDDNSANLDLDHGEWCLCIDTYDKWNDEMHAAYIPVTNCPWCGRELR